MATEQTIVDTITKSSAVLTDDNDPGTITCLSHQVLALRSRVAALEAELTTLAARVTTLENA